MVSMVIQSQVCGRESIERKPWTSEAWNDVFLFLAQSSGIVCAAIFFYSLGPALGVTLMVVSLVVWAFLRSQTASEEEDGPCEDSGLAVAVNSPSRCADPAGLRNGRWGMSLVTAARPVQRQGV